MPPPINRAIRLRNFVSIVFILISVLGFLLSLFTDIIPPIHEWAIQHRFTAISFITFASAAVIMGSSTPIGTVDREASKVREASGYVASDKEKVILEKRRLAFQKILLVLVPAVTIGFVIAVAVLDMGGILNESMFSDDPLYIEGTFLVIKLMSYLMMMAYVVILALVILVVHHAAIYKHYYSDLGQYYKAHSAAMRVLFTRKRMEVEKLEAKDKSGKYVKDELEHCVSVSRIPSLLEALFVVPALMAFLLPSLLANTTGSLVQPDRGLILLIFGPMLLFVLISYILFAVFMRSLRRLESVYHDDLVLPHGVVASRVSVVRTLVLTDICRIGISVVGFGAAVFCVFPIQWTYSVVGFALAGSAILLGEATVIIRKRVCIRILSLQSNGLRMVPNLNRAISRFRQHELFRFICI